MSLLADLSSFEERRVDVKALISYTERDVGEIIPVLTFFAEFGIPATFRAGANSASCFHMFAGTADTVLAGIMSFHRALITTDLA